ncbi:type iii restriction enzyme [Moniliophthora roreri MCA 2997]|uniref:Type iii restriction enzyme n=2 Tax=Moniliophthora roreri TaxID=221103 RepID=V2Y534_MONRO|nr:type iii restriction enzyme [Moniliophthora roreri MCA 2997]
MSTTDILPRRYQEEIFTQAQRENIIAALGTGSGKTYISTLLIKWMATQEGARGKAIIFLVPKVPLVQQQADFIAKHSALRVIKLHSTHSLELTDREGWARTFAKYDVFVMTAQIFLNLLTHSLWGLNKVSLLVLDECHHTRKNHPYNGIMREYMLLPPGDRPKVFGLTASPIQNAKSPIVSLNELQTNMDARVIGVLDHVDELAQHTPKPAEVIQEYPISLEQFSYPEPSLWSCINVFDRATLTAIAECWPDIERRHYATLGNLGTYCASLYLFMEMKNAISAFYQPDLNPGTSDDLVVNVPHTAMEDFPEHFDDIIDILVDYEQFYSVPSDHFLLPFMVPLEWCTPKIKTLVDILATHYTPTFQGIVFVEQRQVATCLARVLPYIEELKGLVKCGDFCGNVNDVEESLRGTLKCSRGPDVVKLFREGTINLLIATSVAEEGLDFPACDIVIRFDPLQHMVAYVQSRGRARNKISKFIVMLPEGDMISRAKYEAFLQAEVHLKDIYVSRPQGFLEEAMDEDADSDADEEVELDMQDRERYVVPHTSAFVNYDNSIALLNHLCTLIPRDLYTAPHVPVYTGDFQATLDLPASLPLHPNDLSYEGPLKHSKKEAKRAVAFKAVKRLRELDVFDEYLLPVASENGKAAEDVDKRPLLDYEGIPVTMDVWVRDPWGLENRDRLWMHPVYMNGVLVAGLVTGTLLPAVQFEFGFGAFEMGGGSPLAFDEEEEGVRRKMLEEYTRLEIWHLVTTTTLAAAPSLYLVPVTDALEPDYEVIERLLSHPKGVRDWSGIIEADYGRTLVVNCNQRGRTLLLHKIQHDLTPMSPPLPGSGEAEYASYYEYYLNRWTRKRSRDCSSWTPFVPTDGSMIEVSTALRTASGVYPLTPMSGSSTKLTTVPETLLIPQGCCSWLPISETMFLTWRALPVLCKRITDIYRAREARFALGLPPIKDTLLLQALTIPAASAGWNNQRLETLGDAVLELCTTVHLFNKYPYKHEGQLDHLRRANISNRFLCSRALEVGLERFITSESHKKTRVWRYLEVEPENRQGKRMVKRTYPRRSLQDCMEALVGGAFETGGIPMALHAGVALGLGFGGLAPWSMRYERVEKVAVSPMFASLEESLGYKFRNGELLREAVTHPSFSSYSATSSYQRLEFLGDAILDLVVIHYLYRKFPSATSHQLALPRTKAVCSPALSSVAIRHLQIHKIMLINNVELSTAIAQYVPHLEAASAVTIVRDGWRYDPPKAISDVFEAIMGAVFIDSGYNYEVTAGVVERVMQEVLEVLSPIVCLDPVSILTKWVAGNKCRLKVEFRPQTKEAGDREGIEARLHGVLLAGPIVSSSMSVAKNMTAEGALDALQELGGERALVRICTCGVEKVTAVTSAMERLGDEMAIDMDITDPGEKGKAGAT